MAAVSVELTGFQFASTELTVTVKALPAACELGAPVLPDAVPGGEPGVAPDIMGIGPKKLRRHKRATNRRKQPTQNLRAATGAKTSISRRLRFHTTKRAIVSAKLWRLRTRQSKCSMCGQAI